MKFKRMFALLVIVILTVALVACSTTDYTVTFDTDGGSTVEAVTVEKGATVTKPADPTKDGFDFVEWQLDGEEFEFTTSITKDITLKAIWMTKDSESEVITVTFTAMMPNNTPEGDIYIAGDFKNDAMAEWDPTAASGKAVRDGLIVTIEIDYNVSDLPVEVNYKWTRGSWETVEKAANGEELANRVVTITETNYIFNDVVVNWAYGTIETVSVTFNTNGGSEITAVEVESGRTLTLPKAPTKDGFKFDGWFTDADLTIAFVGTDAINANLTLYAKWKEDEVLVVEYTVTFDTLAGISIDPITILDGGLVTAPKVPTKQGYTFVEWRLGEIAFDFQTPITSDITLVAYWEENEPEENTELLIANYKIAALNKLNDYITPLINQLDNETLKSSLSLFFNNEKTNINNINTLESAENAENNVVINIEKYLNETFKPLVISNLNDFFNPLISDIPNEELKTSVQNFYTNQIEGINDVNTLSDLINMYENIINDVQTFIETDGARILLEVKNQLILELDVYVANLITKIPSETLEIEIETFYQTQKQRLLDLDSFDNLDTIFVEIKNDLLTETLNISKAFALTELESLYNLGMSKLDDENKKLELTAFYSNQVTILEDIIVLDDITPALTTVLSNTTSYITSLIGSIAKSYLQELFKYNLVDPYEYIPATMQPSYALNLVSNPLDDFTTNVLVSNISDQGFGEQWQMVIENLNQMIIVNNAFTVVDVAMTTVANGMNLYIENTLSADLSNIIDNDEYTATLLFENNFFYLEIIFKNSYNSPLGPIKPVIKMGLNTITMKKSIYLALNENNIIKYTVNENEFELANRYGVNIAGNSGYRTSYFIITKDNNNVSGHIYEYTTLNALGKTIDLDASADFYVSDDYVSVVGNKASGIIGFKGFINELYSKSDGKLLGYKVQEELTFAGLSGTYNTLWFNLNDINGIESIKVTEKTETNTSKLSSVDVYLNNNTELLKPTYNKRLFVETSRKYDIELRSKFYYDLVDNKIVVKEVLVPMMFIQDGDNFNSFASDFAAGNGLTLNVIIASEVLAKIRSDYEILIPVFKTNKENITLEMITTYLNQFN